MTEQNPRGPTPPLYDADLSEGQNTGSCNLISGLEGVIDDIRQIATDLGVRPYTYHSVTVRWSGGEVGRGEAKVINDVAILPTPKTEFVGQLNRDLESAGVSESGDIILTGVSPRFTEDEIDILFGVASVEGDETFIEQRIDKRDGETRRRRFILVKAPERRPTRLDWKVTLRKVDSDRFRDGTYQVERQREWKRS